MHHSRDLTPSQQQSHKTRRQDSSGLNPKYNHFTTTSKPSQPNPHHKKIKEQELPLTLGERETLRQEREGEALQGRPELKPVWVTARL